MSKEKWKKFWVGRTTPLHNVDNEESYRLYAGEINLILKALKYSNGSVLELGCGNGALYPYYMINKNDYKGVDFSESMLQLFKQKEPNVTLVYADASEYKDSKKYDLIFSNELVQHFSRKDLSNHIENCISMLNDDGILLMASIPLKMLIKPYYTGEMMPKSSYVFKHLLYYYYYIFVLGYFYKVSKGIGNWYKPSHFYKYKSEFDLTVFGSLFHPYRFSIAFKRKAS